VPYSPDRPSQGGGRTGRALGRGRRDRRQNDSVPAVGENRGTTTQTAASPRAHRRCERHYQRTRSWTGFRENNMTSAAIPTTSTRVMATNTQNRRINRSHLSIRLRRSS
jgi:hypothetical protein